MKPLPAIVSISTICVFQFYGQAPTVSAVPPTPEAVAQQMVDRLRGAKYPGDQFEKNMPKWIDLVQRFADRDPDKVARGLADRDPDRMDMGYFLLVVMTSRTSPDEVTTRLGLLPGPLVAQWQIAMGKARGLNLSGIGAAAFLSCHIRLYDGARVRSEMSDSSLARFQSIPKTALDSWRKLTGESKFESRFLTILDVEDLFEGDAFQSSRFDAALPIASAMLKEIGRKK